MTASQTPANTGGLPGPDECLALLERAVRSVSADGAEATLSAHVERLTGFAANQVRHATTESRRSLSLAAVFDRRLVRVTADTCDAEGIARLGRRAEEMAAVPREPDLEVALAPPAPSYPESRFDAATAADDHAAQAEDVAGVLRLAAERQLEAAGYLLSRVESEAILNSAGLAAYHLGTAAETAVTFRRIPGRRIPGNVETSGYGAMASWRAGALRLEALSVSVANKALWGTPPSSVPPGRYTVILEPLAVAELLLFLAEGFNARAVLEEYSFLSGRMERVQFSPLFTLRDDVTHPLQHGAPFDGEGWPRQRVTLVDAGRVAALLYDRATASRMSASPTGHGYALPNPHGAAASNLVLTPGEQTNDQLVGGCELGILVTRFWYARPVDPGTLTVTGLTRDGTFLIEDGRVTRRLADLRWNESLIDAFGRIDAVGKLPAVVPIDGATVVTPALRIPGFNFGGSEPDP